MTLININAPKIQTPPASKKIIMSSNMRLLTIASIKSSYLSFRSGFKNPSARNQERDFASIINFQGAQKALARLALVEHNNLENQDVKSRRIPAGLLSLI
jgi:hypothetical protein